MNLSGALSFVSGIATNPVGTAVSLAAGSLSPSHPKDKERAQRAQASLALALQGSLNAAQEIYGLKNGSATAYGKQQYAAAWAQIEQKMPDLAAQVTGRTAEAPINTAGYTPSTADKLREELARLQDKVRAEAAQAAGRVLSGVSSGVQENIDPGGGYFQIPTDKSQLYMIGGVVLAAIVLLWVVFRK